MSVFYFHPHNAVAKKLQEANNDLRGFTYTNRAEMEFRLQRYISDVGYDVWPQCHFILGSLAGAIDLHISLDPDDELDRYSIKLCKTKASWSYVKVLNGPKMSCVIGYSSSAASNPYSMGATEMAQKGIIKTGYVPRQLG